MRVQFDQGPIGAETGFDTPLDVICAETPDQVAAALEAMDAALAAGHWLAGFASYELGYALEPRLASWMPPHRQLPLILMGVYAGPQALAVPEAGPMQLSDPVPDWDGARYAQAFDQVHGFIGAGDIYQANLTFSAQASLEGDVTALAAALKARQAVRFGAMLSGEALKGRTILSRSPELFFATDPSGCITTRPMKGTAPRGATPAEDAALRDGLAMDAKNRAENLMITDLLRNDLARVAVPGSVKVPKLFQVESLTTLHQMTSEITAQLRPNTTLSAIFQALFPCGSITGAPKLRAMEILAGLEGAPREVYCGSIGWAAPDGRAEFNVAIRTLLVDGPMVRMNAGGGVVWDSTAQEEYQEALWKLAFARQMTLASA